MEYNFKEIESKWQQRWRERKTYHVEADPSRPKFYVLDMFPYPSGAGLHVGHPLGYIASDIYSRYKRLKGFNVLHPMGYDAFGLPAEQYAIQTGQHPAVTTERNIARYREQLDKIGFSFDWDREVRTCDPKYYKWTQWAFLEMFAHYYDNRRQQARPIAELEAEEESELLIGWDEVQINGTYDPHRAFWANNFIRLRLPAGKKIVFESFEPYAVRCAAFAVFRGTLRIHRVRLREYAFDASHIRQRPEETRFSSAEKAVYSAACETFRQNCVDVFMDCPGRERAAWLCDSYFMAEAEYFLTGRTDTEDDFLENFILPATYPLPESWMIPMCFPADNPRKSFLPQWPFWLFLEIFEKRRQRGGKDFTEAIRPRFFQFLEGCERYLNCEGFLENLPGWNFIEWSPAENFFQGVHFPTNMLYLKCLKEAGILYADSSLRKRAEHLRIKILDYAFDGQWFHDNATWNSGNLLRSGNISEICQYYADFCLTPLPDTPGFSAWKRHLLDGNEMGKPVPAAMFIGLILRFKTLLSAGRRKQFLKESTEKLLPMAEQTGTLWEKETPTASCCHGFASVLAPMLWDAKNNADHVTIVNNENLSHNKVLESH